MSTRVKISDPIKTKSPVKKEARKERRTGPCAKKENVQMLANKKSIRKQFPAIPHTKNRLMLMSTALA